MIVQIAPASGSVSDVASALRAAGYRVCSLEDLARSSESPAPPAGDTLDEVLDALVAAHPGYRWQRGEDDLVEVAPVASVLDEPASARDWPGLVAELERHGITRFQELEGPAPELELPDDATTVRALLNAAVLAIGPVAWQISGRDRTWYLTFAGVGEARP